MLCGARQYIHQLWYVPSDGALLTTAMPYLCTAFANFFQSWTRYRFSVLIWWDESRCVVSYWRCTTAFKDARKGVTAVPPQLIT